MELNKTFDVERNRTKVSGKVLSINEDSISVELFCSLKDEGEWMKIDELTAVKKFNSKTTPETLQSFLENLMSRIYDKLVDYEKQTLIIKTNTVGA